MQTDPRPEVSHYTYRVTWSVQDREFVATCAEFPSLSWLAPSQIEALQGLQNVLREVIGDMGEQGEAVPQPFADRSY
ncbi:hypothetical protein [Micromonospora sp. NPDC005197]|uniref:hypothetical protein n=1 Tax=Micromonospora sp. NPDC005197 TaxID=3157020 RepID=UPI0033A148BE